MEEKKEISIKNLSLQLNNILEKFDKSLTPYQRKYIQSFNSTNSSIGMSRTSSIPSVDDITDLNKTLPLDQEETTTQSTIKLETLPHFPSELSNISTKRSSIEQSTIPDVMFFSQDVTYAVDNSSNSMTKKPRLLLPSELFLKPLSPEKQVDDEESTLSTNHPPSFGSEKVPEKSGKEVSHSSISQVDESIEVSKKDSQPEYLFSPVGKQKQSNSSFTTPISKKSLPAQSFKTPSSGPVSAIKEQPSQSCPSSPVSPITPEKSEEKVDLSKFSDNHRRIMENNYRLLNDDSILDNDLSDVNIGHTSYLSSDELDTSPAGDYNPDHLFYETALQNDDEHPPEEGNEENKQTDVTAYIRPNLSEMMEGCELPETDVTINRDGIPTVDDSICL